MQTFYKTACLISDTTLSLPYLPPMYEYEITVVLWELAGDVGMN